MGYWHVVTTGGTVDIDATYGTYTTAFVGAGMPRLAHNVTEQALIPGALLQSIKVQPRVLQLQLLVQGATVAAYHSIRKSLLNAFKPNTGGALSPVQLRYTGAGGTVDTYGYYESGLEGNREGGDHTPERLTARFICYDPWWYVPAATAVSLNTRATIADANYVLRCNSGVWANISADFNNTLYGITRDSAGNIYMVGQFTNVGDANGDSIVKWDGSALSSLSTGMPQFVTALTPSPDGGIYIGGSFTDVGDANGDRVVKWTGSAWASLGSGIGNGGVYTLAVGHDGILYAAGGFTDFVDANGDNITKWNGTAWSSLGTGMDAAVHELEIGPDGTLYAAGVFATAGGVAAKGIAKWNGSAWSAVGTGTGVAGTDPTAFALALGPDGALYIGGRFTSVDGIAANNIAKWNGSAWSALGAGVNDVVYELSVDDSGLLYAAGDFTTAGGLTISDRLAVWNGSTWTHLPIDLPDPTSNLQALLVTGDDIYVGYSSAGTAYAAAQTTVANSGSAPAYPTITIARAGGTTAQIQYLKNETTGQTLYLNYSLVAGETLTITLTPGAKAITSSFFGNVIGRALLPNSDFATWCLQPGNNTVSMYVYQVGSPTLTTTCTFYAPHWGADGVAT